MRVPKIIILVLVITQVGFVTFSQENSKDTIIFSALNKSKLQFFLDDTYFFGGIATTGIYYSNNFRDLKYTNGFVLGIEQYFPLSGKVFLSTGINISQRNFIHLKKSPNIRINNLYLDVPVTTAFELPILRNLDFRLILGANIGFRTNSTIKGDYHLILENNPDVFIYNKNDFHRIDFGWIFGLSAEYKNFIFRFRSYSGFVKLDNKDQGMLNSFNFEIGYFLFRSFNNKK